MTETSNCDILTSAMPPRKANTESRVRDIAREIKSRMKGAHPPYRRASNRKIWTRMVRSVLKKYGEYDGYAHCYPWLVDFIWWEKRSETLALVAECEWGKSTDLDDDFQKLAVLKCPLKLFIFSGINPKSFLKRAEDLLQSFGQHTKDEEYIVIAFTSSEPLLFHFKVPESGRLSARPQFDQWT